MVDGLIAARPDAKDVIEVLLHDASRRIDVTAFERVDQAVVFLCRLQQEAGCGKSPKPVHSRLVAEPPHYLNTTPVPQQPKEPEVESPIKIHKLGRSPPGSGVRETVSHPAPFFATRWKLMGQTRHRRNFKFTTELVKLLQVTAADVWDDISSIPADLDEAFSDEVL